MLKGLIVLLMIALVVTLGFGLYYLMIDRGDVKKTRLVNSLRVRVGIAGTLMALIVYGVATGQLDFALSSKPVLSNAAETRRLISFSEMDSIRMGRATLSKTDLSIRRR